MFLELLRAVMAVVVQVVMEVAVINQEQMEPQILVVALVVLGGIAIVHFLQHRAVRV